MSKTKTKNLLEKLDKKIDEVKSSDEFHEMLKFFSKFHDYSYHNTILIQLQKPDASYVAGYRQWQKKFNRQVKKGEEGIAILAPFSYKKTVTEVEEVEIDGEIIETEVQKEVPKVHFKPVYVFDISQTEPIDDTEDSELPTLDTGLQNNGGSELLKPLTEFAINQDLSITYKSLPEGTEGYFKGDNIIIDDNLNDTEKASILVHELGHAMLKHDVNLSREIKELEAEAVAFVVMDHYGIEIKSDKYLALYKKDYDLKESLKRIHKVATRIIEFCNRISNHNIDTPETMMEII